MAHQSLDILDKSLDIDETYVIYDANEISKKAKKNARILKISSRSNIDELLIRLENLNHEEYQNLFIFIIEVTNFEFCGPIETDETRSIQNSDKIKSILVKFNEDRPLILQLTSIDENITKFYYKEEKSCQFLDVDNIQKNFEEYLNFPTFLCSVLDGNLDSCSDILLNNLTILKNSSLILKFLRLFELSDEFLDRLILKCAACGSKSDLMASLDASFDVGVRTLSTDSQNYLSYLLNVNQSSAVSSFFSTQIESEDETQIDSCAYPSILSTAVEHKNTEIIEYLIGNCTHLIQQLPFKHQVKISTISLDTEQLDVLCDLLEISDFPFPSNFNTNQIEYERLNQIVQDRIKFESAIEIEDFKEIDTFIDSNLSLKIVYNPANKSALKQAICSKGYKVYYYLKSLGFQAVDIDIEKELNSKELEKAKKCKLKQLSKNIKNALDDDQVSINLLCNRSFIHDKRISKDKEAEYRSKIRKWYEDINNITFGSDLLNVAASCNDLKLIFDFKDKSVENASLSGPGSLGSTYPQQKWIFIGAKSQNIERDQKIKGVVAHELCHYVMSLVFENNENPYYKHWVEVMKKFDAIVTSLDKWSVTKLDDPDDECDQIISSVFTHYDSKDFHPELIVRVVQVLAQYDDDKDKLKNLQEKYKDLFEYFRIHVLSEMQKFNLKFRKDVRKMNKIMQLVPDIMSSKLELVEPKDIKEMMNNKMTIVSSNVPKLFLLDVISQLNRIYGDIFQALNIFIDPEKLKFSEICEDLKNLLKQDKNLNIFCDYSKEVCEDLKNFNVKFIFIVSNKNQADKLIEMASQNYLIPNSMEISYNWTDLTVQSQKNLLKNKINFQNNSNLTLFDLLKTDSAIDELEMEQSAVHDEDKAVQIFSELIDCEILNLILENSQISINADRDTKIDDKTFEFLFEPRNFIQRHQTMTKKINKIPSKPSKPSQN
ncbi:uncharacterized protein [Chironomus tepperi]|uniref:uncharacterized protein n=1 Tax=Chironomus tepperi TaxID=113505 RepID=UPI00391F27A2